MEPNKAISHVTSRGFDITSFAFVTDIYFRPAKGGILIDVFIVKNISLCLKRIKEASESFGTLLKRFLGKFYL